MKTKKTRNLKTHSRPGNHIFSLAPDTRRPIGQVLPMRESFTAAVIPFVFQLLTNCWATSSAQLDAFPVNKGQSPRKTPKKSGTKPRKNSKQIRTLKTKHQLTGVLMTIPSSNSSRPPGVAAAAAAAAGDGDGRGNW